MRPAHAPDKRCPHGVLTAAALAAVQDRMVDLYVRVLGLIGHHVPYMLQLMFFRHKPPAVVDPSLRVARTLDLRPGVAPHIAVDEPVLRDHPVFAGCVG